MNRKIKEKELFNLMVKTHYSRVLNTAVYYLKNRTEAEDITQDVFLKAFQKLDFSKTDKNSFPILFLITKNLCFNKLKSKGWKENTFFEYEIPTNNLNPEDAFFKKENISLINKAIQNLKEKDREVLILKHFQDCSYSEISEILHIPIGTVMSRLFNARKKLEQLLKGEYDE
ncbi:MAG: sigma-70 family RNA polymerase sigma factor [Spirochaetaceae bacterium]